MAHARCDDHRPAEVDGDYARYALPVGYPATDVTCEIVGCIHVARVWLTDQERRRFLDGERLFPTGRGEVRVSDDLFPN